ncbi:hypothetical protein EYF80_017857 [Liparis tanakae]|uniref:Uncharacterized protein n=1 Tax=Liparis tanakae TaxID=230148 RepID=A0A4Z2I1Y9_9TELE|nr:hypothetical protein EYF80_017857 [Liparis tanakae]
MVCCGARDTLIPADKEEEEEEEEEEEVGFELVYMGGGGGGGGRRANEDARKGPLAASCPFASRKDVS